MAATDTTIDSVEFSDVSAPYVLPSMEIRSLASEYKFQNWMFKSVHFVAFSVVVISWENCDVLHVNSNNLLAVCVRCRQFLHQLTISGSENTTISTTTTTTTRPIPSPPPLLLLIDKSPTDEKHESERCTCIRLLSFHEQKRANVTGRYSVTVTYRNCWVTVSCSVGRYHGTTVESRYFFRWHRPTLVHCILVTIIT